MSENNIAHKFNSPEKINILFLSNLVREKGYEVVLDAFLSLPQAISTRAELHFAGKFYSTRERNTFAFKIKDRSNIFYHGPLNGEKKRNLLQQSHVFCLPTFTKFEGQPISILEAYASGCIVLTTANGGINEIFTNGTNGFLVKMDRPKESLKDRLEMLLPEVGKYAQIGLFNRREAS